MRAIGKFLWRFMVIFSFIVNFVLVAVLLIAGLFIFQIKAQVADPLIGGLHATATGLGESTIDWVIPVRDSLGINLEVPINAETILPGPSASQPGYVPGETFVTLTRPVPITIQNANINAGNLQLSNATVDITLPQGTQLPVALDLAITLDTEVPVELDVRAVIPLSETQLNDPITQLGLLFEPLAIGLHNLPNDFRQAGVFAGQLVTNRQNLGQWLTDSLLSTGENAGFNAEAYDPWDGFSQTAGVGYETLMSEAYPQAVRPIQTGLVVRGGIPALDALLPDRANLYQNGSTPEDNNDVILQNFAQTGIPDYNYDGNYGVQFVSQQVNTVESFAVPVGDAILPPLTNNAQSASQEGDGGIGGVPLQGDSTNTNNSTPDIIPTPSN